MRPVLAYLHAWVLGRPLGGKLHQRGDASCAGLPVLASNCKCAVQALMRPVLAYLHAWLLGRPLGGKLYKCSSMCAAQCLPELCCTVQALMRPVLAYLRAWVLGSPLGGKLHQRGCPGLPGIAHDVLQVSIEQACCDTRKGRLASVKDWLDLWTCTEVTGRQAAPARLPWSARHRR